MRLIDFKIPLKPVTLVHGEPYIKWSKEEVAAMDVVGNLQHAVVGKFSYGWPKMDELKSIIPTQCNIKGDCQIGLFRNRHALIKLSLKENFINVTSKAAYYLKSKDGNSYQMRSLIYDSKFKLEEETTKVIAWISFPYLLPTYYVKEALFSLATIEGITLHLDIGTINKTQPSFAKVEVLIYLLANLPDHIRWILRMVLLELLGRLKLISNMITFLSFAGSRIYKGTMNMNSR